MVDTLKNGGPEAFELFQNIEPHFNKHKNDTHLEVEIRLGKINTGTFDTNVGEETFNKIKRGLEKYKEWEQIKKTETSVYYKNELRTSVDEETDVSTSIVKKNLVKKNFVLNDAPFDIRLAISKEIPVEVDEEDDMEFIRIKKRTSFIRKNLSIDMTVVTGDPSDLDCEDEARYEIELEIIEPTQVEDKYTLYNIIYKIFDVLKILR